jgi:hypothetical protein
MRLVEDKDIGIKFTQGESDLGSLRLRVVVKAENSMQGRRWTERNWRSMCLNVYSFWIAEVKITVREKKLWLSLGI